MLALKGARLAFCFLSFLVAEVTSHLFRVMSADSLHIKVEDPAGETYEHFSNRTGDHASGEWSYADTKAWASYGNPFCDGKSQSPIDIATNVVTTGDFLQKGAHHAGAPETLEHRLKYSGLKDRYISNHGFNLQVTGGFGTFELPNGLYDVVQFNFHFPSEHAFDGKLMTGEMHIVHRLQGTLGTESLAVIAILFQQEEDAVMTALAAERKFEFDFLSNLGFGSVLPDVGKELPVTGTVDIMQAYRRVLSGGFYHYRGSLTAPPCTENVHWYVMKFPAVVTSEMVMSFKKIFPDPANNRPVQPLNNREIVWDTIRLDGEFSIDHDDYAFHAKVHELSKEEAEHRIKEGYVGPEAQEHHGQKGDLVHEFNPRPDFASPPNYDSFKAPPHPAGDSHKSPIVEKTTRAGASRKSLEFTLLIISARLLWM